MLGITGVGVSPAAAEWLSLGGGAGGRGAEQTLRIPGSKISAPPPALVGGRIARARSGDPAPPNPRFYKV